MRNWSTSKGYKIIQVLSGRSNVFLLTYGQVNILIDTGPQFMWKTLMKRLHKLQVEKINLLILTHSHFDHAANAAKIKDKYKAKVMIHRTEAGYLAGGNNILPSAANPVLKFLLRVLSKQFISFAKYHPCNYDYVVDDSYDLANFGFSAFLMHTPGHTQGSMSLIIDNEVALVGDTMFGVFPWTVLPPFATDQRQLLNSCERLLNTKCKVFIPSHGSANNRSLVAKDFGKRNNAMKSETDIKVK